MVVPMSLKCRQNEALIRKMGGYRCCRRTFHLLLLFLVIQSAHAFLVPPSFTTYSATLLYCQLLGMNCAEPTDFSFSFQGFCQRGGKTDIHSDGWGLCFYTGKGVRTFLDTEAASTSPIACFLSRHYPIKTYNMLSHIRFATRGKVELSNVHPFQRELWGIVWCFAHNGDVPVFSNNKEEEEEDSYDSINEQKKQKWLGDVEGDYIYHPVGDTDSEAVFCALLNALRAKFTTLPSLPVLYDTLSTLCREIIQHDQDATILNFLLTCGPHVMFAYSWPGARPGSNVWNGLHYTVREPPFQTATLRDLDVQIDFAKVTSEKDRVAVIATKPLTQNEEWIEMKRGELILFDEGIPHLAAEECFSSEMKGHGLESNAIPRPKLEQDMRRFSFQPKSEFAGGGI